MGNCPHRLTCGRQFECQVCIVASRVIQQPGRQDANVPDQTVIRWSVTTLIRIARPCPDCPSPGRLTRWKSRSNTDLSSKLTRSTDASIPDRRDNAQTVATSDTAGTASGAGVLSLRERCSRTILLRTRHRSIRTFASGNVSLISLLSNSSRSFPFKHSIETVLDPRAVCSRRSA